MSKLLCRSAVFILTLSVCGCGPGGAAALIMLIATGKSEKKKEKTKVLLHVDASGLDNPQPPEGDHYYTVGTELSCSIEQYADDGNPTRYKCTGWNGTGDVPSSGSTNNTGYFTINQDSSITWLWKKQYMVEVTVNNSSMGSAEITSVTGEWEGDYIDEGSDITITAYPKSGYVLDHWEINNLNAGNDNPLTITSLNEPKEVKAVFRQADPPTADFIWSPQKPLSNESIGFTDGSSGDIDTWDWDFGDGNNSSEQNPNHTYTSAGVYTVTLTVYGPGGSDSISKTIAVYDGNIYVSSSGSSTNYGTSWSDAVNSIQHGISLSEPGRIGTVLVDDGTYNETGIDFGGKDIELRSLNGPRNCIIDCQQTGRAFWFHNGETPSAVLDGFTIKNGKVTGEHGGAILCESSSPTIRNCIFIDNETIINIGYGGGGGAIACSSNSSPVIEDCEFIRNNAAGGGAIASAQSSPLINRCRFEKNNASSDGGAIWFGGNSSATIANCLFYRNTVSGNEGGAIYYENSSSSTIVNCTFVANRANTTGGAIQCQDSSSVEIRNSIFRYNSASSSGNIVYVQDNNSSCTFKFCCLESNDEDPDRFGGATSSITEENSLYKDPRMIAPLFGNCNLDYTSPCIDAGDSTLIPSNITKDLTGRPRIVDGDSDGNDAPDIGAYEFRAKEVPSSYSTIRDAVNDAEDGDTVLIFPGTYNEYDINIGGKGIIVRGVGGPPSVEINCSSSGRGFILTSTEPRDTAIVGIAIIMGGGVNSGGGIICSPASPVIKDCIISVCEATSSGGGILVRNIGGTQSDAIIINCEIMNNSVNSTTGTTYGGGIAVMGGATATIMHCKMMDNGAYSTTGAGYGYGSALFCNSNSQVKLYNCLIANNQGDGALYASNNAHMEIVNCTIANDIIGNPPYSVNLVDSASADITNCIIWGNGSNAQHVDTDANVNYSCVEGWTGGGTDNITLDPLFVDASNYNFHLLYGTPCKNAGDNDAVVWETDLDGRRRKFGSAVDMGCYEGVWLVVGAVGSSWPYSDPNNALNDAEDGDAVVLDDGSWTPPSTGFNPAGKNIWFRSLYGPGSCIIDGGGSNRAFDLISGETRDTIIEGFTIKNCTQSYGGAFYLSGASPILRNLIIIGNQASTHGGAIYCINNSNLTIINCLIVGNTANNGGGAIYSTNSNLFIANCTITGNTANFGGGLRTYQSSTAVAIVENSILWGNTPDDIRAEYSVEARYSDIGNTSGPVTRQNCINEDPKFTNSSNNDYHLQPISPCIDAGNWRAVRYLFDLDLSPRILHSSVDMGCYEKW